MLLIAQPTIHSQYCTMIAQINYSSRCNIRCYVITADGMQLGWKLICIYLPDTIQLIPGIFCSRECCRAWHHFRKYTTDTPNNNDNNNQLTLDNITQPVKSMCNCRTSCNVVWYFYLQLDMLSRSLYCYHLPLWPVKISYSQLVLQLQLSIINFYLTNLLIMDDIIPHCISRNFVYL